MGDAKIESSDLSYFADVLTAVSGHLQPAERIGHARRAVEILVARLHNPKTDLKISIFVSAGLAKLCVHLEKHEIARLADTLFTVLSEGELQVDRPEVHADMFKAFVAQMDERDVERLLDNPLTSSALQRNVLDILGASRHRHFRNTWDYLDWAHSNENR